MSDTPLTDAQLLTFEQRPGTYMPPTVLADFARALERSNAALIAERDEIKRDRDHLLKVLTDVQRLLDRAPALLLKINDALEGKS